MAKPKQILYSQPYDANKFTIQYMAFRESMLAPKGNKTPMFHYALVDALTGDNKEQIVESFRGSAKSTTVTCDLPIYLAMFGKAEWFEGDIKNWYNAMNNAAQIIHENDPSHPVTTAHGELPDSLALSLSKNIDVWGMNVYRWDNPTSIFSQWSAVSKKPMYLSEAGGDSYMTISRDEYEEGYNEKAQANANKNILNSVFNATEICSGVAMFSFTDGWWKAGNNETQDPGGWAPNSSGVPYDGSPNEEYWGMVDIKRNKKMTFDVIKNKYMD